MNTYTDAYIDIHRRLEIDTSIYRLLISLPSWEHTLPRYTDRKSPTGRQAEIDTPVRVS